MLLQAGVSLFLRTLINNPIVKSTIAEMLIKLRLSPKISAPKIPPTPGTAARIEDVFAVPILREA